MITTSNQDAYARYDITNILSGYDINWAERINKNAAINPSLYQRIQATIPLSASLLPLNGLFLHELFKDHLSNQGRRNFFTNFIPFEPCNLFFYGNMALRGIKDQGSVVIPPLMVINQIHFCDPTPRDPYINIASFTNYDAPNAQMYGSSVQANVLSNHIQFVRQAGSPENWNARLIIDGIVVGIPKNP